MDWQNQMLEETPVGVEVTGEKRAPVRWKFALVGICIAFSGACGVAMARHTFMNQSEFSPRIHTAQEQIQTIEMIKIAPVNVDVELNAALLQEGLKIYKQVTHDMKELLGYDGFAKQMGKIIHIMADLDKYLKPAEKEASRKLAHAQASTLQALTEARVTILTIHQGAVVLQLILAQSDPEGERVRAACQLWVNNAKSVQLKIDKAKKVVIKATRDILVAKASLQPIQSAMRRFTHDIKLKEAEAKDHARNVCTARGFIGLAGGPVGLVIGEVISLADCYIHWIPQLTEAYDEQTKAVDTYKQTFSAMENKLNVWEKKVGGAREQLAEVEAKYTVSTDAAQTYLQVHAPVVFKALVFSVEQLVKSSVVETVEHP